MADFDASRHEESKLELDIVERCLSAGRDERLSTGALYLEAAEEIERLRAERDAALQERDLAEHRQGEAMAERDALISALKA